MFASRWTWLAAAAGVAVLIALPQLLANAYYVQLAILILLNAVLAMTFVLLLRAGKISLSVAGFWGIGAYASGMLTVKTGMSFWLSVPLALLVAAAVALALGALICRYSGLGFIIPSLLFGLIVPLVFGTFSWFGGYVGLLGVFPADSLTLPGGLTIDFFAPESQYYLLLVLAAISVVVLLAFYAAWTGRTWRAIGYSSKLAESVGVNPFRYRLGAFVLGAVIAALMGAFFTATSMIGFIAGAGIVVRNSIILVDFIELRLKQGMPLDQAVIDAGATRFRPMLLTAAAVFVGSFVILFDPIFQGLAISLMAGEVASLFLSRMAVPVLYYLGAPKHAPVPTVENAPAADSGGTHEDV